MDKKLKRDLCWVIAFAVLLYGAMEHLAAVLGILGGVWSMLLPFLVGGALAFVLNVPMSFIEKHLFPKQKKLQKLRRPLAFAITLAAVCAVLGACVLIVVPQVGEAVNSLIKQIPQAFAGLQTSLLGLAQYNTQLQELISQLSIDWQSIGASVVQFLRTTATSMLSSGIGFFSGVFSGLATFVIGLTFSCYLLFQKEKLAAQTQQVFKALLPERWCTKLLYVARLTRTTFASFLSGQCVEAMILGAMFVVSMSILQLPYAMLIGIIIAVTALIPVLGGYIGSVLGAFLIVMVNPLQALIFVILFLVLQQIEGNLIYPHVVGNSVGLPSIWVLVAVTLGGSLFGIMGILVFIPLCSVLYALFRAFVRDRLAKKMLVTKSEE